MSYAEVAAMNADQNPEEIDSRAPPVPEIVPTEPVNPLVDVDHNVTVVPSDFREQDVQTDTQAHRIELEQEQEERANEQREDAKREAKKEKDKLKKEAQKAKDLAKHEKDKAKRFSQENPAIAVNIVTVILATAVLGVFGVRKYNAGQLTWKLAGTWALGAVGLLGLDFAATKFFQQRGWGNSRK